MHCAITSANNFSGQSVVISRISPVQLAGSVRKPTLNRPFTFPILSASALPREETWGANSATQCPDRASPKDLHGVSQYVPQAQFHAAAVRLKTSVLSIRKINAARHKLISA